MSETIIIRKSIYNSNLSFQIYYFKSLMILLSQVLLCYDEDVKKHPDHHVDDAKRKELRAQYDSCIDKLPNASL